MQTTTSVSVGFIPPLHLLQDWLFSRLQEDALTWLIQARDCIQRSAPANALCAAFAEAPKHLNKNKLDLTSNEMLAAIHSSAGWMPTNWSVDQAARTYLLLSLPGDQQCQQQAIGKLFAYADLRESIALFQALPLLPYAENYYAHAKEATRSNSHAVFNAIALNNSYPWRLFSEHDWNQMVLKAIYLESDTAFIYGFKQRFNSALARMLNDFIEERCSAGRHVPAVVRQCVQ